VVRLQVSPQDHNRALFNIGAVLALIWTHVPATRPC
jgi:hypothetical protein